jgi:type VI secretion system secreted protein VgrG
MTTQYTTPIPPPPQDPPPTPPHNRTLRYVLIGVIVVTIPFYLLGAVLLVTNALNPRDDAPAAGESQTPRPSPIGGELTATATLRPSQTIQASATSAGRLNPTPFQFVPPRATNTLVPTLIIATSTNAPSLTPLPTNTPLPASTAVPTLAPATNTPVPIPTDTPIPPPSETPIPLPTETPIPLPSDTPIPPPSDTPIPVDSGGGATTTDGASTTP